MSRSRIGILLAVAGALGCGGRPQVVLPAVADSSSTTYETANLEVIHRYNGASDIVVVQLYLLGGTRQLTAENAGIEALFFRAAALENGSALARTGSRLTLDITADWTVTGFVCLREDLNDAWAGFASQLDRPALSETSLERARGALLTLARRRHTEPDLRIMALARQAAFDGHPYGIDAEGTEESLSALTADDLGHYWDEEFVTSRMLLVVVGRVTKATIDSLVTATLGTLPAGEYVWTLPPPMRRRPTRYLVEHRALPTNYLLAYFGGPPPTAYDYFHFRVAMALLSNNLNLSLREESALSYLAYAPLLDWARPVGGVYTTTSRPAEALPLIRGVLSDQWQRVGYDPTGWDRFLDGFALSQLLERSTSQGQAETLARARLLFGDIAMADQFMDRIRKVSWAEAGRAARRYMRDIQFAYIGDTTLVQGRWF